ncbi:MAG: hypothetical protein ACRD12_10370, partial [Acidimicrobiales bacterium]
MHIERQKRRHEHKSDFAEIRGTCATIRREYEHSYGRIIDIYVCRHLSHAGVVLTGYELRSRIRGLLEPGLRERGPRVKIATDIKVRYPPEKVVGLQPHFAETLWRAGTLSREARTVLGGKRATHILQRIFNVIQLLLEILDSQESLDENGSDGAHLPDRRPAPDARLQRLNQTLEEANAELDEVQWLLRTWAGRTAEKTYVLGMPIGLLFIILLAVVYARTNVESIDQELLIVSLVGG